MIRAGFAAHHQEDEVVENSVSCEFMLYGYITWHGQQNVKNIYGKFT